MNDKIPAELHDKIPVELHNKIPVESHDKIPVESHNKILVESTQTEGENLAVIGNDSLVEEMAADSRTSRWTPWRS